MQDVRTPVTLRGGIQNLEIGPDYAGSTLGDTFTFWFRPTGVRQTLRANYEESAVIGMSHAYKTYAHTGNVEYSVELFVNRVMLLADRAVIAAVGGATWEALSAYIEAGRRFLEALHFPAARPGDLPGIGAAPPACILALPGICTLRCRVMSLDVEVVRQDPTGRLVEMRAQLGIEEAPMARITMQDQLERGMWRDWGGR